MSDLNTHIDYLHKNYINKNTGGSIHGGINMNSNNLFGIEYPPRFNSSAVSKQYIHNRLSFFRIWHYRGLTSSFQYPSHPTSGDSESPMFLSPNSTSKLTIVGLTSDLDGGGLDSADGLEFNIQYVLADGTNHQKTILQMDLSNTLRYPKLAIQDGQGTKHNYAIFHNFYINAITNYQDIRLIFIGIRQYKGVVHGNETTIVVGYSQDPV